MSFPKAEQESHAYRFRNPDVKPTWGQLTRLGGDRVTILLAGLRKRLAAIEGLLEDLEFTGPEEGWAARYRRGGAVLFTAHVLPGSLEVTLPLDASRREKLLASPKTGAAARRLLRKGSADAGKDAGHLRLRNESDVRSFSALVITLSRLLP